MPKAAEKHQSVSIWLFKWIWQRLHFENVVTALSGTVLIFKYLAKILSRWTPEFWSWIPFLLLLLSRFSCVQLCNPIDGSLQGSPVPRILPARTPKWFAISFSNAWKWKVKVKTLSRVWLLATPWTAAYKAPPSMGFSKQEYWSGVPLPSPLHLAEKYFILERLLTSYKTCIHLANIYPLNMGQKRLC